jgi:hypothetical protein
MKTVKLCQWFVALALMLATVPAAALSVPSEPGDSTRSTGVESISGSWVYVNPTVGGGRCFVRNAMQDFCFTAVSFTDDWDYVFYLWMRFPADWTIHSVSVQGTPACQNGGIFKAFSWSTPANNEVRIEHERDHANPSDRCEAHYCFHVTSGSPTPGLDSARVSWYWISSGYGSRPWYPCSSDGYTPTGQQACDESTAPAAWVNKCPSVYLPIVIKAH